MILVDTKKANKIIEELEKRDIHALYQIRKGSPDARYKDEYHLCRVAYYGCQCTGTYGNIISSSKTLIGLLSN